MAQGEHHEQVIPYPPHWPPHPFLQFAEASPGRSTFITNVTLLLRRNIESTYCIDWDAANEAGITAHVAPLLVRDFRDDTDTVRFTCRGWDRLTHILEPTYRELCLEFYATVQFDHQSRDFDDASVLTFRMGGVYRQCSMIDLAVRLGVYTADEAADPYFRTFLEQCLTVAHSPRYDQGQFWLQTAGGVYIPSLAKESDFRSPITRLLHRFVTTTLYQKKEKDKVAIRDLYYTWCLLDTTVFLNLPYLLAWFLGKRAGKVTSSSTICGGHFITRLARSYGILTDEALRGMDIRQPRVMTRGYLCTMGVTFRDELGRIHLVPDDDPEVEPEPIQMEIPVPAPPPPQPRRQRRRVRA